jgi:hypothetical protein
MNTNVTCDRSDHDHASLEAARECVAVRMAMAPRSGGGLGARSELEARFMLTKPATARRESRS